jgi:hypothetical protein
MDSLPYVCNDHHAPSTPHTPALALAIPYLVSSSTLAETPLAASTDLTHRIPPPRISTTTGSASLAEHVCASTAVYGKSRVVHCSS